MMIQVPGAGALQRLQRPREGEAAHVHGQQPDGLLIIYHTYDMCVHVFVCMYIYIYIYIYTHM